MKTPTKAELYKQLEEQRIKLDSNKIRQKKYAERMRDEGYNKVQIWTKLDPATVRELVKNYEKKVEKKEKGKKTAEIAADVDEQTKSD